MIQARKEKRKPKRKPVDLVDSRAKSFRSTQGPKLRRPPAITTSAGPVLINSAGRARLGRSRSSLETQNTTSKSDLGTDSDETGPSGHRAGLSSWQPRGNLELWLYRGGEVHPDGAVRSFIDATYEAASYIVDELKGLPGQYQVCAWGNYVMGSRKAHALYKYGLCSSCCTATPPP